MLTLEQIESAILQLPPEDYKELSKWFADRDYQLWDEQLEQDIVEVKDSISWFWIGIHSEYEKIISK